MLAFGCRAYAPHDPFHTPIPPNPNPSRNPSNHTNTSSARGVSSLPPVATPVLGLTESQREYYELARAFAEKELAPEKVRVKDGCDGIGGMVDVDANGDWSLTTNTPY